MTDKSGGKRGSTGAAQVTGREVLGAFAGAAGAIFNRLRKDLLSTFLLLSAIALAIIFFNLLGSIQPSSSGERVAISEISAQAKSGDIVNATLLDNDSRVVVNTTDGRELYAAYPGSDAQTAVLLKALTDSGASVQVDQQAGKPTRQILVQFLLPILLLVCLCCSARTTRRFPSRSSRSPRWASTPSGSTRPQPVAEAAVAEAAVAEERPHPW